MSTNIFWEDLMLVAYTYRGKNGFKEGELDKLLKYLDKKKEYAYVLEGEAETQHMHGLIVQKRDRNSVTNIGAALRTIAKTFEGNDPKYTVKVTTAYKGAYQEEVGSNYGNYLEYMCKGDTTKLVTTLPETWEEYLTDDIAPEDRRTQVADEQIEKCIQLLKDNICDADNGTYIAKPMQDINDVYEGIHTLVIEKKWKHQRTIAEIRMFACKVHAVMNAINIHKMVHNYKRLIKDEQDDVNRKRRTMRRTEREQEALKKIWGNDRDPKCPMY